MCSFVSGPFPSSRLILACGVAGILALQALAADPVYQNDFEKTEVGKVPEDFTVVAGAFTVQQEGGNKFLELPGSPLDSFGFLFGPPLTGDAAASARVLGTRQGRKFPTFGISLNGVSGYRLQVSPAKKSLEIYKGEESKVSVPFEWVSGQWTRLRIEVRKSGSGWVAAGKAWPDGKTEPAEWLIKFEDTEASTPGRAGLWANPYAGTPTRFDDLRVENVK